MSNHCSETNIILATAALVIALSNSMSLRAQVVEARTSVSQ